LSSLPARDGRPASAPPLAAVLYDANRTDTKISIEDVTVERLDAEQLLWIDADIDDLPAVVQTFGLEAETAQAIRKHGSEPALFAHDRYVHVVVVVPGEGPAFHEAHALHCLVGLNWVVTVHRDPIEFLGVFDERIRGDSELGKLDAHGFLAAILQEHVARYLAELRPIEADLDRIDFRSMTGRMEEEGLLHELVAIRLRLARLRRLLEPHRELFALLTRSEFTVLSGSQAAPDFSALGELLERALQSMEATREMIIGSFEIYTTWTAHGTNKVIKRLTVVSVALLPPTLLAGVMGMNSLPKIFITSSAFWISIAAIAALPLTVLAFAKRRSLI
jgi:Mg2+ and Co2+ transporter CorA